jgi:chromosome segregation ATPase
MKNLIGKTALMALLTLALAPGTFAADSADQAQKVKERLEALRLESVTVRRQVEVSVYELNRLQSENVELREQFEKFKSELGRMEEQAKVVRARVESMGKEGQAFFKSWEDQIGSISNPKIQELAKDRYNKRQKSYKKILAAMTEARDQAQPFLSDLKDVRTLLDSELTRGSVKSSEKLIKRANYVGSDVVEALKDVETELDRVAAELNRYE